VLAPLVTAVDDGPDERGRRTQVVDVPMTPAVATLVASQSRVEPARTEGAADVEIAAFVQRHSQSLADGDASGPRTAQHQDVRASRGSQVDTSKSIRAGVIARTELTLSRSRRRVVS